MLLNAILGNWLNGADFSVRRLRHRSVSWLLGELSRAVGRSVGSVREAYEAQYGAMTVVETRQSRSGRRADEELRTKGEFLRPYHELREFVTSQFSAEELVGFYVHGSLATLDYVERYSDFDTLVIVRNAVLDDPEWVTDFKRRLVRSNTFLYLLDPLQHHQHFVVTEHDLEHYFEPIFPIVLFEYAVELTGWRNMITFRCHDPRGVMEEQIATRRHYFGEMWPSMRRMGAYDVKNAVQNVALLPTLYLQLKTGEHLYKRFSFDKAKVDFSEESWSVVERASRVRQTCPYRSRYPYGFRRWLGLRFHYRWLQLLHRHFDRDNGAAMVSVMGPAYLEEALRLTAEMERRCTRFWPRRGVRS
jgi:predicted nucleotidyltransferase